MKPKEANDIIKELREIKRIIQKQPNIKMVKSRKEVPVKVEEMGDFEAQRRTVILNKARGGIDYLSQFGYDTLIL